MNKLKKSKKYLEKHGLMKYLQGEAENQKKPDYIDSARLHKIAIKRKASTILEFGVGWSTIILADALRANGQGKIFSVDSSKHWISVVDKQIPPELKEYVELCYSDVEAGKFNGRICHFFKSLPDIVPNFIYLDGPDPKTVKGDVNGLTWKNKRNVIAADILLMEPTFSLGTFIIIDKRINNAQFLINNLQKKWSIKSNGDITTLELTKLSPLIKRVLKKVKSLLKIKNN